MTPLSSLSPEILNVVLLYFQKSSQLVSALVGLLFVARVSILVTTLSGPSEYGETLKDTLQYFIIISLFPQVLKISNQIVQDLASRLYWEPTNLDLGFWETIFKTLKESNPLFTVAFDITPLIITHLAQSVSTLMICLLVAIGPIVILLNTMLDYTRGLSTYFTALVSFMLWPVLWNMLGTLSQEILNSQSTGLIRLVFASAVLILQSLSPLFCIFLFSSLAPGKAISQTITKIITKIPKKGIPT
jgi:hypothetical protein